MLLVATHQSMMKSITYVGTGGRAGGALTWLCQRHRSLDGHNTWLAKITTLGRRWRRGEGGKEMRVIFLCLEQIVRRQKLFAKYNLSRGIQCSVFCSLRTNRRLYQSLRGKGGGEFEAKDNVSIAPSSEIAVVLHVARIR